MVDTRQLVADRILRSGDVPSDGDAPINSALSSGVNSKRRVRGIERQRHDVTASGCQGTCWRERRRADESPRWCERGQTASIRPTPMHLRHRGRLRVPPAGAGPDALVASGAELPPRPPATLARPVGTFIHLRHSIKFTLVLAMRRQHDLRWAWRSDRPRRHRRRSRRLQALSVLAAAMTANAAGPSSPPWRPPPGARVSDREPVLHRRHLTSSSADSYARGRGQRGKGYRRTAARPAWHVGYR